MSPCWSGQLACVGGAGAYGALIVVHDWRDDRIKELEAIVCLHQATIGALERRVQELEAQLAKYSGNSSRPPSSDPPGAPPPAPPKRTGRTRGGQPGHDKQSRALVPPEQVTRTEVIKPQACRRCGGALEGDDPDPYRHQVIEVPKAAASVAEYQLHALDCPRCGISTRATLPAGVPSGNFGPRLQAIVAVCSGAYRMSKRGIEELVEDFFGVPISLGSVANLEQATSEAIKEPIQEIARAIHEAPVVHADETGWFERGKRAWLWVAITAHLALFLVRRGRGAQVAKELLGAAFAGILVSDRWSAYTWVDVARRQLCWAHLLRQFRGFKDYGPEASAIGRPLELLTEAMFHAWHRVRDGTMTRAKFQKLMTRLKKYVLLHLRDGLSCPVQRVAGRCREILTLEPALWTFVYVEGVEPTNNAAEHGVRHGVMWRKTSFGTDSPSGSRFVERILTVVTTLRLQGRNVLDYVTEACEAALQGRSPPSLLPG
jgi:transposase